MGRLARTAQPDPLIRAFVGNDAWHSVGAVATIDSTASVAPTAVLTCDVTVGPNSRILHGAVLNADLGPIRVGTDVVIMEHALLRARATTRSSSVTRSSWDHRLT
jgi:carbonic anhydrase/acetyltransferase-like protein (isoleucine patch superfamily)